MFANQLAKRCSKTLLVAVTLCAICQHAVASTGVFQKVARSTVLIIGTAEDGSGCGSGVLIDQDQRIVLTAAHVVNAFDEFVVVFPKTRENRVLTSAKHYSDGVEPQVIQVDETRDIALLRLPDTPEGMPEVSLASDSPRPGQTVYAIGNASFFEGGVFGIVTGMIRHVYEDPDQEVKVINSSLATNRGDSGGPVVNENGELVGIVSRGTTGGEGKQLRDFSPDISEIRTVLKSAKVAEYSQKPAEVDPPLSRCDSSQLVNDDAPTRSDGNQQIIDYPNGVRIIRDEYGRAIDADFSEAGRAANGDDFTYEIDEAEDVASSSNVATARIGEHSIFSNWDELDSFLAQHSARDEYGHGANVAQ